MPVKSSILLTGGTGFLGSFLLKKLVDVGHPIILLKRKTSHLGRISEFMSRIEVLDLEEVDFGQVFKKHRIETVLHCATDYGRSQSDPLPLIEANLILPLRLLHAAASHGTRRFINTDTILDKRVSHYSLSKKQFLDWLREYSSKMSCINVALEHFYGPGDNPTKFLANIISQIVRGIDQIDLTPGEQKRDFVYIDDVQDAFMQIIDHSSAANGKVVGGFQHFEVGTGNSVAIKEVLKAIKVLAGNDRTELRFGALPYRRNEVMESKAELEPLRRLGFRPKVTLEEGLIKTIAHEKKMIQL